VLLSDWLTLDLKPVPLLKFQMAPRLKIFMSAGSIKRTQLFFSFLSNPGKQTFSRFPNKGPMEREGILHISRKPHKNSSNKKALRKKRPSIFPTSGAPMEADAYFWALFDIDIYFGSLVKEPSLKVPFMESLAERHPTTRALLHSSFKVPGIWAPLLIQSSLSWKGASMERDAHIRSLS